MSQMNPTPTPNPITMTPTVSIQASTPEAISAALAACNPSGNSDLQTSGSVIMTVDNMATVATAAIERQIRRRLGALNDQIAAVKKDISELETQCVTFRKEWPSAHFTSTPGAASLASILGSASALIGVSTIKPTYTDATFDRADKTFSSVVSARSTFERRSFSIDVPFEAPAPTPYLDLMKQIDALNTELSQLQRDQTQARLSLGNMDTVERQAKASIVQTAAKNAGGKAAAAMDALNAMIGSDSPDDHIKMLSVG